jgi:hypothetical protein
MILPLRVDLRLGELSRVPAATIESGGADAEALALEPGDHPGRVSVTRSVYFDWRSRAKHGRLEDLPPIAPRLDALVALSSAAWALAR